MSEYPSTDTLPVLPHSATALMKEGKPYKEFDKHGNVVEYNVQPGSQGSIVNGTLVDAAVKSQEVRGTIGGGREEGKNEIGEGKPLGEGWEVSHSGMERKVVSGDLENQHQAGQFDALKSEEAA